MSAHSTTLWHKFPYFSIFRHLFRTFPRSYQQSVGKNGKYFLQTRYQVAERDKNMAKCHKKTRFKELKGRLTPKLTPLQVLLDVGCFYMFHVKQHSRYFAIFLRKWIIKHNPIYSINRHTQQPNTVVKKSVVFRIECKGRKVMQQDKKIGATNRP